MAALNEMKLGEAAQRALDAAVERALREQGAVGSELFSFEDGKLYATADRVQLEKLESGHYLFSFFKGGRLAFSMESDAQIGMGQVFNLMGVEIKAQVGWTS